MTQILNPSDHEIARFDGVTCSTVYSGGFSFMTQCDSKLKWREDDALGEICYKPYQVLTLSEIAEQMKGQMITIFVDGPLVCTILQYGNYGDSWWNIGEVAGYA